MASEKFYYKMELAWHSGSAVADTIPQSDADWLGGKKFDHPFSRPLVFTFTPGEMHHYYPTQIPLMSDELLASLRQAGVDNIESFPAVINIEGSDNIFCHYKAINVLGVGALLKKESSTDLPLGFPQESSIIVDEGMSKGLKLFRIEDSAIIVVDASIKETLQNRFSGVAFTAI